MRQALQSYEEKIALHTFATTFSISRHFSQIRYCPPVLLPRWYVRGHEIWLHNRRSRAAPSHSSSSSVFGSRHNLVRVWSPPPQLLLHWLQAVHNSQKGSVISMKRQPIFIAEIWIQREKCIQMRTNKLSIGPVFLEIPLNFGFDSIRSCYIVLSDNTHILPHLLQHQWYIEWFLPTHGNSLQPCVSSGSEIPGIRHSLWSGWLQILNLVRVPPSPHVLLHAAHGPHWSHTGSKRNENSSEFKKKCPCLYSS